MGIETIKLNKNEHNDWDLARQVRDLLKKGVNFRQACDKVLKTTDYESTKGERSRIASICGEISGRSRKKIPEPKAEPEVQGPYEDIFSRSNRERRQKAKAASPLFADQIEEEMREEEKRRGF